MLNTFYNIFNWKEKNKYNWIYVNNTVELCIYILFLKLLKICFFLIKISWNEQVGKKSTSSHSHNHYLYRKAVKCVGLWEQELLDTITFEKLYEKKMIPYPVTSKLYLLKTQIFWPSTITFLLFKTHSKDSVYNVLG